MHHKPLVIAFVFLAIIALIAFLVFSDVGTRALESELGTPTWALTVTYVAGLTTLNMPTVAFTLNLIQTRIPSEAISKGYSVQVNSPVTFNDSNFTLTFTVTASMANNIQIYSQTFTFQDGQDRTVTCFLVNYDATKHLSASASGSSTYQGQTYPIQAYSGQWN